MKTKVIPSALSVIFIMITSLPLFSMQNEDITSESEVISAIDSNVINSYIDEGINCIKDDVGILRKEQEKINFLNDGFNLLGIISIGIAIFTVLGLDRIRTNNVNKKTQYRLFADMIRHLYRNKVCTLVMYGKWRNLLNQGKDCYPSEEHFLKLQMLPEDLHFERYYQDPEKYHLMHEMELLLRNYNTEIEVAKSHLCNSIIDLDTKERDFATLNFKAGYLTLKIVKLMNALNNSSDSLKKYCNEAAIIIKDEHKEKEQANINNEWNPEILEILTPLIEAELEEDPYYKNIFEDSPS